MNAKIPFKNYIAALKCDGPTEQPTLRHCLVDLSRFKTDMIGYHDHEQYTGQRLHCYFPESGVLLMIPARREFIIFEAQ